MNLNTANPIYENTDGQGNVISLSLDRQELYANRYDLILKLNERKFTVNKFSTKKDAEIFLDLMHSIVKQRPFALDELAETTKIEAQND